VSNKSADQVEQSREIEGSTSGDAAGLPSQEFGLSKGMKIAFGLIFSIPALFVLLLLVNYGLRPDAKPSEFSLGSILIFCLTGLVIVLVPWGTLGLRLKKIGPLEFEQVISTQKKEQSESFAFLQGRIDELKKALEARPSGVERVEPLSDLHPSFALPIVLQKFLRNYPGRFFSPFTIKNWGSKRPGFEEFDSFSKTEISQALLTMLAANQVQTKISKRGNTLYGISRRVPSP
jgi:hypothetical protein